MLTEKPWRLEPTLQLLVASAVCMFLSAFWIITDPKQAPTSPGALRILGATLTFQGAVVVLFFFFVRKHSLSIRDAFGFNLHPGRATMLGITAALLFVPVAIGLQLAITKIAALLHIELAEQNAVELLKLARTWPDRAAFGFMAIIAAPLAEEGLFRGVFYPALKRLGLRQAALWITSLSFALIHFNVMSFIPLVVLAVLLTMLYEHTGNLLTCIVCHASFNALQFAMLFLITDSGTNLGS